MKTRGIAAGLALALGFVCGCDDAIACNVDACASSARLTGSVPVSTLPTLVDVSLCSQDVCQRALIELKPDPTQQSCTPGNLARVCLLPSDGRLFVTATWPYGEGEQTPRDGTSYQLQLTNHSTGASLVDVTRSVSHWRTSDDACHHCFYAEMSL